MVRPCLGVLLAWALAAGAASPADASGVLYNGGPVAHSMTGLVVDWGASINSVYTDPSTGDPGLVKYLAAASGSTSDIGGVLAQYMDSSLHNAANQDRYGGQYQISPSVSSSTIYDSQISSELASQIEAGNLPHPSGNGLSTIYLVLFPAGVTECIDSQTCSGSYFCAYHSRSVLADGTNVLYAVLPDNMTGAMAQGCGSARTLLQDQTSYLSHEWAEAITDPLGNAWWDSSSAGTGDEIADLCNQYMTQNGSWTVQEEWSNLDGNCEPSEPAYGAPAASFLAASAASTGETVSFDASSSSDPSQNRASALFSGTSYAISSGFAGYRWSWGDGTPDTSATTPGAAHRFSAAGTYQVSLTVTDNLGFTSTITHSVSVDGATVTLPSASTGAARGVNDQGATLAGEVNPEGEAVSYRFDYGTSPGSLSQSTALSPGPTGQSAQPVSAILSGLEPGTTYYYQLVVQAGGQIFSGSVESFSTQAASASTAPAPQTPLLSTGSAEALAPSGATLSGSLNPGGSSPVSYWFAYGTSASSLTSTTPSADEPGGDSSVAVNAPLGGLAPGTTYYFELEASVGGTTYTSQVSSFTTHAPAPGVSTGRVSAVTSSTASVAGSVTPNGVASTYFVEFGPTRAYGYSTPALPAGAGTGSVPVSIALGGLRPRTTYHYRLVASSPGGSTVGADASFTTPRAPARAPRFAFRAPRHLRARAVLARHLRVRYRCSKACAVHFVITTTASGLARTGSVPLTLARGKARLARAGSGTGTLRFLTGAALRLIRHHRGLRLVISAYAVGVGSQPSPPKTAQISVG